MPFKSQAQAKFFRAIASGDIKNKSLKPNMAQRFIEDTNHQKTHNLPEHVPKKQVKFHRIKKSMKG